MKKTFDDIVVFARTGLNPRTNFKLGKGTNKYITIKNIHNNTILIDDNTDVIDDDAIKLIHKRSQIKKGDILFCSIGRMGDMYIIPEEPIGWDINESVFAFTLNTDLIRQKYFYYIFKHHKTLEFLSKNSSGSTFKSIKMNQLKQMTFEIPTIDEQDKIITILDNVCKTIDLRKQQLQQLDELVKARFVEMFGDPKLNDKGWECGILADHFEVKGGKRIPKGMGYSDIKTNHPYLRATDMKNETIIEDDIHYISEEVFQHIKRYTVNGGDIYLTNVGVNLGMAGVIPQKFDGASLTENAVKLVPKVEQVLDGLFLAHYINSPGIQDYINERKMAVGVPKLAIFRIETMPLLIPPMEIQKDFIAFVKQVDKSKVAVQKALDEAQTLFDSLMQKYFG